MKTEIQPHPTPFPWGQRTFVMGIINVTPDSFSGDGLGANVDAAVEQGLSFESLSADMLDVGGQSTRPGHTPVSEQEELIRVIPVVKSLASRSSLPISIDTFYARVAAEALSAGASIINDQWALRRDPEMAPLAAEAGVPRCPHAQPRWHRVPRPHPRYQDQPCRERRQCLASRCTPREHHNRPRSWVRQNLSNTTWRS